jgi:hypothetical protein
MNTCFIQRQDCGDCWCHAIDLNIEYLSEPSPGRNIIDLKLMSVRLKRAFFRGSSDFPHSNIELLVVTCHLVFPPAAAANSRSVRCPNAL